MKREYTETFQVNHFEAICDVCGYAQKDSWRGFGKCEFCKKHVCWKHYSYSLDETGDYPKYFFACPEHEQKLRTIVAQYEALPGYPSLPDMVKQQR